MKKQLFTGSGVAIVTPMHPDGSVDFDLLGKLIEFQIKSGTEAIIICGTTGESPTLSHDEHISCVKFAVEKTAGRIPVIAGAGGNNTKSSAELSIEVEQTGADGLLLVTPYYNKTTQTGLIRHFFYIADRVNVPIILYNIPSRTGLDIKPETYLELSKHPNITGIKEANCNIESVAKTASLCGDEMAIYSGNDAETLPILSLGGKGVISVLANIMPKEMHDLCKKFFDGDVAGSRKLQLDLMGLISALFIEVNPIPIKHAMNLIGYAVGECRMPLAPMLEKNAEILKTELKRNHLL
ncbi:MAG TPA: 4-hydroxy-tetrahydrodipicolinate synthase [Clostridia bacterium]|nr:4-hydroxy-tetrahydrodipicolinate synthase [Clostridia bacterium]